MNNFTYFNPVKIYFGNDVMEKLPKLINRNQNILLVTGEGFALKSGLIGKIENILEEFNIILFSGITPNPSYEICMDAVETVKSFDIDFIIAIGGGSVIDAVKFISAATYYTLGDPWEILSKHNKIEKALPFGTILTLPATGSEMNNGSVITRNSTKEKLVFQSDLVFPKFSILDPSISFSLSKEQTANGIVDAFVHVLEQYLTININTPLQDRQAEAVLLTLIEEAPKVLAEPDNYEARANVMWSATAALNKNLSCGVVQDWSTHLIGHELSALFNMTHARSLASVLPSILRTQLEFKKDKLVQFGKRVWNIDRGTADEIAMAAIDKTVEFFESMGVKSSLKSYNFPEETIWEIPKRFARRKMVLGEHKNITPEVIYEILRKSLMD